MKAIETTLVYLVAALLGFVLAECFMFARRAESKLVKTAAWIAILYLTFFGSLVIQDGRVWQRSLTFPTLYLTSIAVGIVVGVVLLGRPNGSPSALLVPLAWAIVVPLLIIVDDFGQFLFFVRESSASLLAAVPIFGVFGLVCALLALRLQKTWIAWVVGAIPILLYYDAWVTVPLLTAYILGCRLGTGAVSPSVPKGVLVIVCVSVFTATAFFDGYMRPYTLRDFGVFFPSDCGPAFLAAMMFPLLFISGALLTRLAVGQKAHNVAP